jgi:hypothetical protein
MLAQLVLGLLIQRGDTSSSVVAVIPCLVLRLVALAGVWVTYVEVRAPD